MGSEQEKVVLDLLGCATGRVQDVDGMVSLMSDDMVWQINVPSLEPIVGREACRAEIEQQNAVGTGGLPGSEIRNMASNDRVVFTERVDVFEYGGKEMSLPITGVFEVEEGKVVAWREYFDMAAVIAELGIDPNTPANQ